MTASPSPSPASSPGSLTAVMRAAKLPEGPPALRVGLVHEGKMVDERVVKLGESVTIGRGESATFVVNDPSLPHGLCLFDSQDGRFRLHVSPRMSGRLTDGKSFVDVGARGGPGALTLGPDARGKVVIGHHIVLFHGTTAAPPLGKPQLPASVKAGVGDVDWRTSMIAAFSFLFHFGAVGTVYSDWLDPVVDDDASAAQLIESVKSLPSPPAVEKPREETADLPPSSQAKPEPAAQAKGTAGGMRTASAGAPGGGRMSDGRAHQISSQLAGLEMQMLVAIGPGGSATDAVLMGKDVPLGMLEQSAASAAGTRSGGVAGLDLGGATGGPFRPGSMSRGVVPGDTSSVGPATAGSAASVRGPTGNVGVAPPTTGGGEVPGAPGVVAGMTPGFRRCYRTGLTQEDPTMKGTIRLTLRIGSNGEVQSASAAASGNLSATVVGCVRARAASAQFSAPTTGGATLVIPVTLIPG